MVAVTTLTAGRRISTQPLAEDTPSGSTPEEAPMTARVGDEIMIMPQELHEPVREGQIREIRHDPGGVVYLVQWSDTVRRACCHTGRTW